MRYKIFSERTGLKVSELALGTGMFGQAWGYGATPEEVSRIIAGFADAGGKIVYGGLSNFPAWRIATAANTADLRGWTAVSAIQIEYNLLQRTPERELLPMADGFGLGVMGYSPMAAGILTGKYRKGERGRATDLKASVLHAEEPNNDTAIDAVSAVAQEVGAKPGQVAVAWVKAKGVLPIVGTRTREQLDEHLAALTVTLSDDQIRRLDTATSIALGYPHELNSSSGQREVFKSRRHCRQIRASVNNGSSRPPPTQPSLRRDAAMGQDGHACMASAATSRNSFSGVPLAA